VRSESIGTTLLLSRRWLHECRVRLRQIFETLEVLVLPTRSRLGFAASRQVRRRPAVSIASRGLRQARGNRGELRQRCSDEQRKVFPPIKPDPLALPHSACSRPVSSRPPAVPPQIPLYLEEHEPCRPHRKPATSPTEIPSPPRKSPGGVRDFRRPIRPSAASALVRAVASWRSVFLSLRYSKCSSHFVMAFAWPWIAQMDAGRAGWYSWDAIDNGGTPSARRVVPELQTVVPGDVMPAVPRATNAFVVASVDPPRDLVLTVPDGNGWAANYLVSVIHFPMQRKQLIGIARRAELTMSRSSAFKTADRQAACAR
jgi:hypothetical protein